jgi:hypothetical protein
MDDRFLKAARQDPRPEFAEGLRDRLARQSAAESESAAERTTGFRWAPALAASVVVLVSASLILFPSVRASAQAFLDLFRVRNFAAVSIDPERLKQLDSASLDMKGLLSDHIETIQEPGPLQVFTSPEAAGSAAGFMARVPRDVPAGFTSDTVAVKGAGAARLTVDAAKLREIVSTLGIQDVVIPPGIDGAKVELRMPASVQMEYRNGERRLMFLQAHSPEVSLPPGIDLAQLGEVGLRIAGMEAAEAKRFARSIDWHSTMLIPVPSDATEFSEVEVRGNKALLINTTGQGAGPTGHKRSGSMVMWAEGGMVYALCGNLNRIELVSMANSVQ